MGVTVLVFTAENVHPCISSDVERGLGRVTKWHVCGRGKKALKNNRFYGIYIEISQ